MNTFCDVHHLLVLVEIAVSLILFKGKKLKKSTKFALLYKLCQPVKSQTSKLVSVEGQAGVHLCLPIIVT